MAYEVEWLIKDFVRFKQSQGRDSNTLHQYRREIELFFKRHDVDMENYHRLRHELYDYLSMYQNPYTYNIKLTYLKAFFAWCVEEGVIDDNPLKHLSKRKTPTKVNHGVTIEVVRKILDLCDLTTFAGLRDYALILFSMDTGARPNEALNVMPEDCNFKQSDVVIRAETSKVRQERVLPITYATAKAMRDLIAMHHPSWGKLPVFCSSTGKPFTPYNWCKRLRMYSNMVGVRVRPYDLRHLFAITYLRNGASPFHVQKMLGHEGLEMTRRYIALSQADIKEGHVKSSPVEVCLKPTVKRVRGL
jgi:site-specific recombinase XerD